MREHQIVITLKPEQFLQVQKLAKNAGAKSMGMFVRQKLLVALGIDAATAAAAASAPGAHPDIEPLVGELKKLHTELREFVQESLAMYSDGLLNGSLGTSVMEPASMQVVDPAPMQQAVESSPINEVDPSTPQQFDSSVGHQATQEAPAKPELSQQDSAAPRLPKAFLEAKLIAPPPVGELEEYESVLDNQIAEEQHIDEDLANELSETSYEDAATTEAIMAMLNEQSTMDEPQENYEQETQQEQEQEQQTEEQEQVQDRDLDQDPDPDLGHDQEQVNVQERAQDQERDPGQTSEGAGTAHSQAIWLRPDSRYKNNNSIDKVAPPEPTNESESEAGSSDIAALSQSIESMLADEMESMANKTFAISPRLGPIEQEQNDSQQAPQETPNDSQSALPQTPNSFRTVERKKWIASSENEHTPPAVQASDPAAIPEAPPQAPPPPQAAAKPGYSMPARHQSKRDPLAELLSNEEFEQKQKTPRITPNNDPAPKKDESDETFDIPLSLMKHKRPIDDTPQNPVHEPPKGKVSPQQNKTDPQKSTAANINANSANPDQSSATTHPHHSRIHPAETNLNSAEEKPQSTDTQGSKPNSQAWQPLENPNDDTPFSGGPPPKKRQ